MKRIERVQNKLLEWGVDELVIENPIDLFYLTGVRLSKGVLSIQKADVELLVDGRYFAAASRIGPCSVKPLETQSSFLGPKVGFDSATTSVDTLISLKKKSPQIEWIGISEPLKELRLIKEASEIKCLEKAAQLTWQGYCHVRRFLKEGITEQEVAFEFEMFVRKQGASALSFDPIIAFGQNSAYPHYHSGSARLEKNQIVLIDVGAVVEDYRGDLTRTFFFGQPSSKLQKMIECVEAAQAAAFQQIQIGAPLKYLDAAARAVFAKEGVESLFSHSLGHGIGLETHEYPRLKADGQDRDLPIQPGMVFTIEPGIYQPGLGGVRIEDMICITEKGYRSLYPKRTDAEF